MDGLEKVDVQAAETRVIPRLLRGEVAVGMGINGMRS